MDDTPEQDGVASGPPAESMQTPRPSNPVFLGQAMGALLRSADVQIQRDDQTRVLSRANEALAEVERRRPGTIDEASPQSGAGASSQPSHPSHVSGPPRPRVDTVLWLVLAAGLFGIIGFLLFYGL